MNAPIKSQNNLGTICRCCGTLTHIKGSDFTDFPVIPDADPHQWHGDLFLCYWS